ncbi:MAG: putative selenium-dependent hydroxylase accessory protein YqeC [Treponema sp.]|nr:putative selenium-dependent hydroxylase accessory protein YqeC [Treponema sp.]
METLSGWFEQFLFGGMEQGSSVQALTVIGSGGKTSLVWLLARCLAHGQAVRPVYGGRKILVTPASKMLLPAAGEQLFDRFCNGTPGAALPGVTLAGRFNEASGKLESLEPPVLERIAPGYDLVLVEGDGSKGLPLKGWAEHEPVVPQCTAATVGVIPLWPLGRPASSAIIHRLPLFCALSGAEPEELLGAAHIAAVICGFRQHGEAVPAKSLFSAARGKKILFFNQIENETAMRYAQEVTALLPPAFCSGLEHIIAGSVRENSVRKIVR